MTELYWYNTGYACGGLIVRAGVIVQACPIYRSLVGREVAWLRYGQLVWCGFV